MNDVPSWKLKRERIREAYALCEKDLVNGIRRSPYDLGIDWEFSPIEYNVWGAIRFLGLPLYPQYPVGPYFVDFGDPKRKIAIEVDSIRWHKDKKKDQERDHQMRKLGWKVFRIPSRMTYKTRTDFEDESGQVDEDFYREECAEGYLVDIYEAFTDWKGIYINRDL